ncbi:MAG: hypothetical protein ABR915_12040 [Thermoguttaceae bacterium]
MNAIRWLSNQARVLLPFVVLCAWVATALAAAPKGPPAAPRGPLDPVGKIHIPIGIANTVDTLKTFVEAEGPFSPGCGSYGVYFWLFDLDAKTLAAPTDGRKCDRGLPPEGYLIPWTSWSAGDLAVTTRVCEVERASPAGNVFVVGATAELTNRGERERTVSFYAALRPIGPAGFAVKEMSVSDARDALLVEGHPVLVCNEKPGAIGVAEADTAGQLAGEGKVPGQDSAKSEQGNCSGAARHDLTIGAGKTVALGFICPVLPGRRAVGHDWDGRSGWAQLDLNAPNPSEGGSLQPDPGLAYYRGLKAEQLFAEAAVYWKRLAGGARISLPDPRWAQCLGAIVGHAAMEMNEGAPDVAVVNYNVFNRDGVYVANILQKSGCWDLSEKAIDYFLGHPFNGRVGVEADNPGQVLWIMGQHWSFSRDRRWLDRVYPSAAKIAAMIRYYRTTPAPHYVKATSLEFGDSLPPDQPGERPATKRQILRPGSCDGTNPNYTEAFDIAGLRAITLMAGALGKSEDARTWDRLASELVQTYDQKFSAHLPARYGSYAVLWPCALYPYTEGKGYQAFKGVGAKGAGGWFYFPLATAHQGLLTGNRVAGHGTIEKHLDHPQCVGWYAFDEGGGSGTGGWKYYRTTWKPGVAMPHGWAIAELWLLMRDCLAFEDRDRLVLLGGAAPDWFRAKEGMAVEDLPTHFGKCSFRYTVTDKGAVLTLSGDAAPPGGFVLRMPKTLVVKASAGGTILECAENRDLAISRGTKQIDLTLSDEIPDKPKPKSKPRP